ncbi:MAG TPA: enoyl-CoA hydratase/isomerase family protein [Candidatus Margulisiibacteriota bacterium]|nr:enoyl-CoA hydratase/isomerase family protein [Candidatus Margulisiibacteriota bacterium]
MALIRIEQRQDTAVLFFARPPANAFDLEFTEELHARLDELAARVPAGGVVVTGEGRTFSGGVDFKAVPGYTRDQRARMIGHINACITILYGLPTATVAAVNGHAIGGAFVVMLACDARLAADTDAKLGLTEVTAGIPYPACPMEVVKAEIEPSYRRHLVLTGDIISPHVAHARGLIDELVAPENLPQRSVEVARARAAARSYGRVKQQLKGDTVARMRAIIAASSDPMLEQWV